MTVVRPALLYVGGDNERHEHQRRAQAQETKLDVTEMEILG